MAGSEAVPPRHEPRRARDHLIVALDVPKIELADSLVRQLDADVSLYKIGGHLLFANGLVEFIERMVGEGKRIFLDLKSVDIGETMRGVASRVTSLGVEFLTVMGTGATISAAIEGRGGRQFPRILVVTLLTDHSQEDMRREYGTDMSVEEFAADRARYARQHNADGVISSPLEVSAIRKATRPDFIIVTPGIRPLGVSANDQKRIATPATAIMAGSDYLVVGRPIVKAADARSAACRILDEIQTAIEQSGV
ncbi:MAG: orotidine-5'-phosphate decarboxylase [Pseudomonadota bacterium]